MNACSICTGVTTSLRSFCTGAEVVLFKEIQLVEFKCGILSHMPCCRHDETVMVKSVVTKLAVGHRTT